MDVTECTIESRDGCRNVWRGMRDEAGLGQDKEEKHVRRQTGDRNDTRRENYYIKENG